MQLRKEGETGPIPTPALTGSGSKGSHQMHLRPVNPATPKTVVILASD